jgi:hypothetical protein
MLAFRFNNLVYIPITKHASSSYTELFRNALKWDETSVESINWVSDKVFAHIINPHKRHLKGIHQCLIKYDLLDLLDRPEFLRLLGTAVFDLHSYPLSNTFGDKIRNIDWLVLDHHECSGNYVTMKFLQSHKITINENAIPRLHESNLLKKQLLEKIETIRNKLDPGILDYFYGTDVRLYNAVYQTTAFHELERKSWQECSWLNSERSKYV